MSTCSEIRICIHEHMTLTEVSLGNAAHNVTKLFINQRSAWDLYKKAYELFQTHPEQGIQHNTLLKLAILTEVAYGKACTDYEKACNTQKEIRETYNEALKLMNTFDEQHVTCIDEVACSMSCPE